MGLGESTAWIVVGLSGWAVLLTSFAMVLHARARGNVRRAAETASPKSATGDSSTPAEHAERRDDAREDGRPGPNEPDMKTELQLIHALLPAVSALDLERILARGLEAAAEVANPSAAMVVLALGEKKPLVATFGLTSEESFCEQVGLPPESGEARAVQLAYSYSDNASLRDAFPLRSGLVVPIASGEDRLGTLALYWRRFQRQVSDDELRQLEAVARAMASALKTMLRLEEARPFELDGVTGLPNGRAMRAALGRECARARRYDRRVALILLRLDLPLTNELLSRAGELLGSAVRSVDLPCYLGERSFAVILPEAALADAQRLHGRLEAALVSRLDGFRIGSSPVAVLELRVEEDPVSFFDRAQRELARAAQDEARTSDGATRELDLASA